MIEITLLLSLSERIIFAKDMTEIGINNYSLRSLDVDLKINTFRYILELEEKDLHYAGIIGILQKANDSRQILGFNVYYYNSLKKILGNYEKV